MWPQGDLVIDPTLVRILSGILTLLWWAIIVRVILSWVMRDTTNPMHRVVSAVTDPVLVPLQRFLTFGGIDLSPVVVLFLIQMAQRALANAAM